VIYNVKEIFGPTLQGEGLHQGRVVYFLRFSGCNKWSGHEKDRSKSICSFCDTDFINGTKMTEEEILDRLNLLKTDDAILIISGGEPFLQLKEGLLGKLKENNFTIHVETNGSVKVDNEVLSKIDFISCSPKQKLEETKISRMDEVKFLHPFIFNHKAVLDFKEKYNIKKENVFIQPIYREDIQSTIDFVIENDLRISLQQHKQIGVR